MVPIVGTIVILALALTGTLIYSDYKINQNCKLLETCRYEVFDNTNPVGYNIMIDEKPVCKFWYTRSPNFPDKTPKNNEKCRPTEFELENCPIFDCAPPVYQYLIFASLIWLFILVITSLVMLGVYIYFRFRQKRNSGLFSINNSERVPLIPAENI